MKIDFLRRITADQEARRAVVLATDLKTGDQDLIYPRDAEGRPTLKKIITDALRYDRSGVVTTEEGEIFLNVFNPPLRMIIVGAVHAAQALGPIATIAGYDVTIVDPRAAFASAERFPHQRLMAVWPDEALPQIGFDERTCLVALTHDPKIDDLPLGLAVDSPCFYVGALGSRRTHAARLERLAAGGVAKDKLARIHGPIGLDIGARGPAEIAISIMAEVTANLRVGDFAVKESDENAPKDGSKAAPEPAAAKPAKAKGKQPAKSRGKKSAKGGNGANGAA